MYLFEDFLLRFCAFNYYNFFVMFCKEITSRLFQLFKKNSNFVLLKRKAIHNNSTHEQCGKPGVKTRRQSYKVSRRYRVEIINENTLSRLWSVKLRGTRALLAAIAAIAAVASLVAVVFMFTPLGRFLPGHLRGDLRGNYTDAALRIDSIERVVRARQAYLDNITGILNDSLPEIVVQDIAQPTSVVDSLISAGDNERRFVKQYEEEHRFNLSVLSPIAAEGMIFERPALTDAGVGSVTVVYRGTVVSCLTGAGGFFTVVVQHPNDFITVYASLSEVFVERGEKVVAGQRIGRTDADSPLSFELWHSGLKLDPAQYIPAEETLSQQNMNL